MVVPHKKALCTRFLRNYATIAYLHHYIIYFKQKIVKGKPQPSISNKTKNFPNSNFSFKKKNLTTNNAGGQARLT